VARNIPIRRAQMDVAKFAAWLAKEGAEVGIPTNRYEVVRYKAYWRGATKAATHIVYAKENGLLTWTGGSLGHYRAFLDGAPMGELPSVKPETTKEKPPSYRGLKQKRRDALAERDGHDCWFCGKALGDDRTIEHLVPKSKGGPDKLANYALAHEACNRAAADMPLVEKIALREKLRAQLNPQHAEALTKEADNA